jgi:IS30 family transposase
MPNTHRSKATEQQWLEAVTAFELGYENGSQIARRLGVSPSTVSREFKRRGARKACRVHETVAELEATLDAKARRLAAMRAAEDRAAMQRLNALDQVIAAMIKSIVDADRDGDLASTRPLIREVDRALGMKGLRRTAV